MPEYSQSPVNINRAVLSINRALLGINRALLSMHNMSLRGVQSGVLSCRHQIRQMSGLRKNV